MTRLIELQALLECIAIARQKALQSGLNDDMLDLLGLYALLDNKAYIESLESMNERKQVA